MLLDFYPSLLKPGATELILFDNQTIEIPKVHLNLKKWFGIPIANTFGGKPLIDFDGVPMFAELAIMKLFLISGWQARWVETYGAKISAPFHFSNWIDGKLTEQPLDLIPDNNILEILHNISLLNGGTYSGCWDVVGWFGDHIIFAETKRLKKDALRQTQQKWLSAGMSYGLKPENFLIVQWDFVNEVYTNVITPL